jgi:hypothetical protein
MDEKISPELLRCQKFACAIEWCLSRRNYNEEACKDYIDAWKKCHDKAVQQKQNFNKVETKPP